MKKALINPNLGTILEVVEVGEEFPSHKDLLWVDADDATTRDWVWDGTTLAAPTKESITEVRRSKRDEINDARAATIHTGVQWNGNTWDTDPVAISNVVGAVSFIKSAPDIGIPLPATIVWRTQDDIDVELTPQQVIELGVAVFQHVEAQYRKSFTLKDQIEAATTVEDVRAVRWQ